MVAIAVVVIVAVAIAVAAILRFAGSAPAELKKRAGAAPTAKITLQSSSLSKHQHIDGWEVWVQPHIQFNYYPSMPQLLHEM